ncbi:MAG TPA: fibronectin type III domain-containing protein [Pyrinomonadaceae bacterium]
MNRLTLILCLSLLPLLHEPSAAQQLSAIPPANGTRGPIAESSIADEVPAGGDTDSLRQRRTVLSKRLEQVEPSSSDYDEIVRAIRQIDIRLHGAARAAAGRGTVTAVTQAPPSFQLSTPGDNLTNETVQPTLSWTEDQNPAPRPVIERYIVEISDEQDFGTLVYKNEEVKPRPHPLTVELTVPEGVLEPGVTYHWRVSAVYSLNPSGPTAIQLASNAPFSFTTARSIFKRLSDRGFTLQRAVEGRDASKGAEFSFLRTLGKNTVYTADFALIHNHRFHQTIRTSVGLQTSVEGKLTSDESESEDAWRFRAGAVIDRNLKPGSLNLIYLSLGGKFEGDQDFDVKKMSFEALFTPTLPDLFIGVSKPLDTASPFQFRWRPFFSIDAGRTIRKGSSSEVKENIFRLIPRATAKLKLNFLNEVLKLNDVYLWMDETFYYLPLESKKRRNFFTSGLEFEVTDNLGFGLTYKNGESAPKFNRVNTLGATISIRFGKEDQ